VREALGLGNEWRGPLVEIDVVPGSVYNPAAMASRDPLRMYDKRTVKRNIRSGRLQDNEYGEFLEQLPDLQSEIRDPEDGGDDDGYDDRMARRSGDPEEDESTAAPSPEANTGAPSAAAEDTDPAGA
jgi:hypothetical protein